MRRAIIIFAAVVGIIGATALPAAATWGRTILYGNPGSTRLLTYRAAEGGACGAPNVLEPAGCNVANQYDQIFLNRFQAYTAPYNAYQQIQVDAYLFFYNASTDRWQQAQGKSHKTQVSATLAPGQSAIFGNNAPDVAPCNPTCIPVFAGITPGFTYTVGITISWTSGGALLAQANYFPSTDSFHDLGCAQFAIDRGRCATGYGHSQGLPTNQSNVGYVSLT